MSISPCYNNTIPHNADTHTHDTTGFLVDFPRHPLPLLSPVLEKRERKPREKRRKIREDRWTLSRRCSYNSIVICRSSVGKRLVFQSKFFGSSASPLDLHGFCSLRPTTQVRRRRRTAPSEHGGIFLGHDTLLSPTSFSTYYHVVSEGLLPLRLSTTPKRPLCRGPPLFLHGYPLHPDQPLHGPAPVLPPQSF